jgi:hypothetical protein
VQHIAKRTALNMEKVRVLIIQAAGTLNKVAGYNKTVVKIDPLIEDIIRSREVTNFVSLRLNHEEEVPNIYVEVVHVQPLQVDDYVLAETQRETNITTNSKISILLVLEVMQSLM